MCSPFLRESPAVVAGAETEYWLRASRRKLTVMLQMQDLLAKSFREFKEGSIVKGRILEIRPREVLVDIGVVDAAEEVAESKMDKISPTRKRKGKGHPKTQGRP